MKKTILIKGTPFTYNEEHLTCDTSITQEEGRYILEFTKGLLDELGIKFALSFGTLLGAVRDKDIIKGDQDVDVLIKDEKKLYENLPYLQEKGLHVVRIYYSVLYSFRINERCYIDLYVLRPLRFSLWSINCISLNGWAMPRKFFKNFVPFEFLGNTYFVPENPERLLEYWYGKEWRIPKSGKGHYEVRSAYYFHKFAAIFIKLLHYEKWRGLIVKDKPE